MQRYSNQTYQFKLPQIPALKYEQIEPTRQSARTRVWQVDRRLDANVIQQLVRDYEAGMHTTELTERYSLGKGTVLKLLEEAGVTLRRQALSPTEVEESIRLYAEGWSLARIGQRFGRAHTVIRKALLDRDVQLRPRNGWNG